METDRTASPRGWLGAASGVAFAVAILVAMVLTFPPDARGSNAASVFLQYYTDKSTQTRLEVGAIVAAVGVFLFLWFLGQLTSAFRESDEAGGSISAVGFAGGLLFAVLALFSFAASSVIGASLLEFGGFKLDVNTAMVFSTLSYSSLGVSMFGASALLAVTGTVGRRSSLIPRWLSWTSYGLAVIAPVSAAVTAYAGLLLFLVWVAVTGVVASRKPALAGATLVKSATVA